MADVSNTEDVLDSRDIIARIEELKAEWTEATEGDNPDDYALSEDDWSLGLGDDGAAEMVALLALAKEGESSPDWQYGETLIRDSYFTDYAQELAEETGMIPEENRWPLYCIDWDRAARELQQDYFTVDYGDVTYWIRA